MVSYGDLLAEDGRVVLGQDPVSGEHVIWDNVKQRSYRYPADTVSIGSVSS